MDIFISRVKKENRFLTAENAEAAEKNKMLV